MRALRTAVPQGQASDIVIHAAEIVKLRARLNQLYQGHTGQPLPTIGAAPSQLNPDAFCRKLNS